jgi:hypothetical protein
MPRNTPQSTYALPSRIQEEYQDLMRSKEIFLKKRTPAESRVLETLYDALSAAWNRNLIEALRSDLERTYRELREIQGELRSNFNGYEKGVEVELKRSIEKRSNDLGRRKSELASGLSHLKGDVKTWKADIERREKSLKSLKEGFEIISNRRNEILTAADLNLKSKQEALTETLKRHAELSKSTSEEDSKLQQLLSEARLKTQQGLQPKRDSLTKKRNDLNAKRSFLTRKKQDYRNGLKSKTWNGSPSFNELSARKSIALKNLNEHRERNRIALDAERTSYEQSLRTYERESLDQLWTELVREVASLPKDLRSFCLSEHRSLVSQRFKSIDKEYAAESKIFDRELMKHGFKKDEFLALGNKAIQG